MSSSAEHYLTYQIVNAPVRSYPYPHIYVKEVFPPDFYSRILQHLPPAELMSSIKQVREVGAGYSEQRFVLPLAPAFVEPLPEPYRGFWRETATWLLAARFTRVILSKFWPHLERRFSSQEQQAFYNEAMLVEDRTRYSLGPHTDSPLKVLTFLFYLSGGDSRSHFGTSIYVPRDPEFRCPGGPHYPFDRFERVFTIPYRANTLFAFMKTDNSFHGVEPIQDEDCRRHLLLYDIRLNRSGLAKQAPPAASHATEADAKPTVDFSF